MNAKQEIIASTYNKESNKLLNYIKKYLPAADAEDILQDVFSQLFVGFEQIKSIESVTGWLFKTAMNRIIDLKRKKKPDLLQDKKVINYHSDEDSPLMLEEIVPSLNSSPEDEIMRKVIWEQIEETLDELPEAQREVFILHEFEDRSFKEISSITGESINTLLSRKRYAILYLREKLIDLYEQLKTI
jgi:RNA polymerase sigma factor (sigma-70 family)